MQGNLLDTHALIWFFNGDKQLSSVARAAIEKENVINYVSIVSIWEIAIKISLGKLELKAPFTEINNQLTSNNFIILPIQVEHALLVSNLPFYHRDPFDRLLIAQALQNDLTIISRDERFAAYSVSLTW